MWDETTIVAGAEVYDFQGHRLTEIYPDKRLARERSMRCGPASFRWARRAPAALVMQGEFFGCGARSGQGGAFRQIGDTKIAVFVVVNARGSVTDRNGRLVRCHQEAAWQATRTADLLTRIPRNATAPVRPLAVAPPARPFAVAPAPTLRNTTLSLVVTNRKLSYANLQRLAVQVHTSMARAIQPFSTSDDGDILFAVSTQEDESSAPRFDDLTALAGELMWDAILASVPAEPAFKPPASEVGIPEAQLAAYAGTYRFGPNATIKITLDGGRLMAEAVSQTYFDLRRSKPIVLKAITDTAFYVDGRYRTRIAFVRNAQGNVTGATINAGPWQQTGRRVAE